MARIQALEQSPYFFLIKCNHNYFLGNRIPIAFLNFPQLSLHTPFLFTDNKMRQPFIEGSNLDENGRSISIMPRTSDNDKKAQDNNAFRHEKNMMQEKNRKAGKNQYSKKTDHL